MSIKRSTLTCEFEGCEKGYTTQYNLKRHMETAHSDIKRFVCDICAKPLSSKQNLYEHSFTHTKIRPFRCQEPNCGQIFRQRSQLSNHKKLHRELQGLTNKNKPIRELKVIPN